MLGYQDTGYHILIYPQLEVFPATLIEELVDAKDAFHEQQLALKKNIDFLDRLDTMATILDGYVYSETAVGLIPELTTRAGRIVGEIERGVNRLGKLEEADDIPSG